VPPILEACVALAASDPQQGLRLASFLMERPPAQIRANIVPKIGDQPWTSGVFDKWKRDYEEAISDYSRAIQFSPWSETAYKNLAWLLATCPNASLRDGKKAVEYATKACVLSEWKDPKALRILAVGFRWNDSSSSGRAVR
jgi:tetratricopeptide (TPR) repeat protein